MGPGFSLRAMTPEDGPAITALSDQSTDTGAIGFHNLYQHDAYAAIMALHENACGVVAEAPDHPGIVGMGMMSLGECLFEGALRPFAYLFSLSVHPAYRRRGIASQLAAWRIQTAREKIGPDGLIYAGIQGGNTGSLRTAARWSNQSITGRTRLAGVKMRTSAPSLPEQAGGLEIRPTEAKDYEAIAHRQNTFYAGYNLYPPRTADAISSWHAQAPFGERIRGYTVVSDRQGNLLAGMSVTEEAKLVVMEIQRMSRMFRVANALLKYFPPNGKITRLHVKDLWYAPGQQAIGQFLWESLRWQLRERASMMMAFIDTQSPLAQMIQLPWYLPNPGGSLVLSAPLPVNQERLVYFFM